MNKFLTKKYITVGVLVLFVLWTIGSYNSLVGHKGKVEQSWSNVSVQLQRRFELIPNLVNTVKGNANFEQETLTQVVEARNAWAKAQSGGDINEQIATANQTQSALARLLVTVEAYPTLQANQAFQMLQIELTGTENRIAVARKDYNEAATGYNVIIQKFPTLVFAKIFGFEKSTLFEAANGSETAPTVNFE